MKYIRQNYLFACAYNVFALTLISTLYIGLFGLWWAPLLAGFTMFMGNLYLLYNATKPKHVYI